MVLLACKGDIWVTLLLSAVPAIVHNYVILLCIYNVCINIYVLSTFAAALCGFGLNMGQHMLFYYFASHIV